MQFTCGHVNLTIWKEKSWMYIMDNCVNPYNYTTVQRKVKNESGSRVRKTFEVPLTVKYYCATKNMVDVGNARRAQYGLERQTRRMHNNTFMAGLESLVFVNGDILSAALHRQTRFDPEELRIEWIESVEQENNIVNGTKLKPRRLTLTNIRRSINGNHRAHHLVPYKVNARRAQIECKYHRQVLHERKMTTWMCDTCNVLGNPVGFCNSARTACWSLWSLHNGAGDANEDDAHNEAVGAGDANDGDDEHDDSDEGDESSEFHDSEDGAAPLDMRFLNEQDQEHNSSSWNSFRDGSALSDDVDEDGWPNSWFEGSADDSDDDHESLVSSRGYVRGILSEDNGNVNFSEDDIIFRAARFEADEEIELSDRLFVPNSEQHRALLMDRPIYPWNGFNGDRDRALRHGEIDALLCSSMYTPQTSGFSEYFQMAVQGILEREPKLTQAKDSSEQSTPPPPPPRHNLTGGDMDAISEILDLRESVGSEEDIISLLGDCEVEVAFGEGRSVQQMVDQLLCNDISSSDD